MLFWVPVPEVAAALEGLPGASVEVVAPDGGPLPAGAAEVEFYAQPRSAHDAGRFWVMPKVEAFLARHLKPAATSRHAEPTVG